MCLPLNDQPLRSVGTYARDLLRSSVKPLEGIKNWKGFSIFFPFLQLALFLFLPFSGHVSAEFNDLQATDDGIT